MNHQENKNNVIKANFLSYCIGQIPTISLWFFVSPELSRLPVCVTSISILYFEVSMNLHSDNRTLDKINKENLTSSKIFIQYPIRKICNLRCSYCFHQEYFDRSPNVMPYANTRGFMSTEFKKWMETHIYTNFNEIIIHFSGGEPFYNINVPSIRNVMFNTNAKFDFLTNGVSITDTTLDILSEFKSKIHRIGFTYHRDLEQSTTLSSIFEDNVMTVYNMGIPVYVKELLHKDYLLDILNRKRHWEKLNIPFKIQDLQNLDSSPVHYNARDLMLIDDEYKHQGKYCSCWQGYRSISIRGYDIAAGDVIACWLDPKIIGNVAENTLSLNFCVEINELLGRRNVTGGNYSYSDKGTFERDRKSCEH